MFDRQMNQSESVGKTGLDTLLMKPHHTYSQAWCCGDALLLKGLGNFL